MSALRQCVRRAIAYNQVATCTHLPSVATSSAVRLRHASSSAQVRAPAVVENGVSGGVAKEMDMPPYVAAPNAEHNSTESRTVPELQTLVSDSTRLPHLKPMLEMAEELIEGAYIADAGRLETLQELIAKEGVKLEQGRWPVWVEQEYEAMRAKQIKSEEPIDRTYRRARSMLWVAEDMSADKIRSLLTLHAEKLSEPMQTIWSRKDRQEQLDVVLRPYWDQMSDEERKKASLRARFRCLRSLGWRKGYTSGYPIGNGGGKAVADQRQARLDALRTGSDSNVAEAAQALLEEEERDAWNSFSSMGQLQREQEERLAWKMRDRALVFIDDSSSSRVAGVTTPRWYAIPQRVGSLTFLPNVVIRLVRNANTRGARRYDAFKATFRVPLSMHKHGLRTYLLAIYGLRTTWCRSMIYRAPIKRTRFGRKEVGSSNRTFKKVEVGILEPFVFPELTESFARQHLYKEEMRASSMDYLMRLSQRNRWRSNRLPDPIRYDQLGATVEESDRKAEDKEKPRQTRLSTLSGGLPSKRQSRILKHLADRRKVQEAIINAEAQSLKAKNGGD